MKLVHQCIYCSIGIFDTSQDLCWKSPGGKHNWRIIETGKNKNEEQPKNNNLKEVIYV